MRYEDPSFAGWISVLRGGPRGSAPALRLVHPWLCQAQIRTAPNSSPPGNLIYPPRSTVAARTHTKGFSCVIHILFFCSTAGWSKFFSQEPATGDAYQTQNQLPATTVPLHDSCWRLLMFPRAYATPGLTRRFIPGIAADTPASFRLAAIRRPSPTAANTAPGVLRAIAGA